MKKKDHLSTIDVVTKTRFNYLPVVDSSVNAQTIIDSMNRYGGVIIKNYVSKDDIKKINLELEPNLQKLDAGSKHDYDLAQRFHGANTKRLTNLATFSETFRKVLDIDLFHEIGEKLYREEAGDWWLTTAQLIEIGPGNKPQPLHRDLQNNPPFVKLGIKAPTVITNLMLALTEFTEENGATRIIPGSQSWDEDYLVISHGESETIAAVMEPGDALLFSGKVIHGGGANITEGEFRRGIVMPIQPAYLTPEEAYPFLIPLEVVKAMPQRVQKILGFRSLFPNGSAGLWQNNYEEIANYLNI